MQTGLIAVCVQGLQPEASDLKSVHHRQESAGMESLSSFLYDPKL